AVSPHLHPSEVLRLRRHRVDALPQQDHVEALGPRVPEVVFRAGRLVGLGHGEEPATWGGVGSTGNGLVRVVSGLVEDRGAIEIATRSELPSAIDPRDGLLVLVRAFEM